MQVMHNLEKVTGYSSIAAALAAVRDRRDPNAMRFCLELVRPLVAGVVNLYIGYAIQKHTGTQVSRDDLEQSAFEALIKGMSSFTAPVGATEVECRKAWNTYAGLLIKGPVRDAYASACVPIDTPNWALKVAKRINHAITEMEVEHHANHDSFQTWSIDPLELARRSRVELSKVKRFIAAGFYMIPSSRFIEVETERTSTTSNVEGQLQQLKGHDETEPAIILSQDQSRLMDHIWRILPERERTVLAMRYGLDGEPVMVKDIAEKLGVTRKTVLAIEKRALSQVREFLMAEDEYSVLAEAISDRA